MLAKFAAFFLAATLPLIAAEQASLLQSPANTAGANFSALSFASGRVPVELTAGNPFTANTGAGVAFGDSIDGIRLVRSIPSVPLTGMAFNITDNTLINFITASFTLSAVPIINPGDAPSVAVQIYQAPPGSGSFSPAIGSIRIPLSAFTQTNIGFTASVAQETNIQIPQGSRVVLVFSITPSSVTGPTSIRGYANAGITLQPL